MKKFDYYMDLVIDILIAILLIRFWYKTDQVETWSAELTGIHLLVLIGLSIFYKVSKQDRKNNDTN